MQFFLIFEHDKEAKTDTRKMIYFEMTEALHSLNTSASAVESLEGKNIDVTPLSHF